MQFTIQIVSVDITTKPTAKGSYQQATLAFRDLQQNKLKEKKVMSFTPEGKALFDIVSSAQKDQTYTIDAEKEGEYWVWKAMMQQAPGTIVAASQDGKTKFTSAGVASGNQIGSRTYETAEERAERQVLIVRQSSLSAAVATLNAGKGTDPDKVVDLAERYSSWVFQKDAKESMFKTETTFDDIPNDL